MSFLKELGEFLGEAAGTVVGKSVKWVGEKTEIPFVAEVGEMAYQATKRTGSIVGQAASDLWDIGAGVITQDDAQLNTGFRDVGGAVGTTATGIINGVVNIGSNAKDVVVGAVTQDKDKVINGAVNLAKVAAVSTLAIGVLDVVDGVDVHHAPDTGDIAVDSPDVHEAIDATQVAIDNPGVHNVTPYMRHMANGQEVWVDGIPDPSVHGTEGWYQSNPDVHRAIDTNHSITTNTVDTNAVDGAEEVALMENPNTHHVNPYYRHQNGKLVYVDGIDDPSVHGTEGWDQSNPDLRVKNEV